MIIRRAVLQGLVTVPVIATASTVLPAPVEVLPASQPLLEAYNAWLWHERRALAAEMYPGFSDPARFIPANTGMDLFHADPTASPLFHAWADRAPSRRAHVILVAAGVDADRLA